MFTKVFIFASLLMVGNCGVFELSPPAAYAPIGYPSYFLNPQRAPGQITAAYPQQQPQTQQPSSSQPQPQPQPQQPLLPQNQQPKPQPQPQPQPHPQPPQTGLRPTPPPQYPQPIYRPIYQPVYQPTYSPIAHPVPVAIPQPIPHPVAVAPIAPVAPVAVPVYANSHPHYQFTYGVNDPHTGDIKSQQEERDGDVVKGQYSLLQPDGITRIVYYTADNNGFHAQVTYSGPGEHLQKPVVAVSPVAPIATPVAVVKPVPTLTAAYPTKVFSPIYH